MIGSFLTRLFVLFFGYAYPAYECYKTVEKNKPEIQHLRFWCQYWILVAMLTVCERFGDTFMSWVPMYSEAKIVFYIYLWYPKTKGTEFVYDSFFKPYVSKHESEIDRNLMELRARIGDMVVLCFQNAASYSQTRAFEILQFVASQSIRKPQTSEQPQQQAPKVEIPAAAAANRRPSVSKPLQNEELSSPTSSNFSTQHQHPREIGVPSKAGASPNPAVPIAKSSPRKMSSGPASSLVRKTVPPASDSEVSSNQFTVKKVGPESSLEQSGANEAESKQQIEPTGGYKLEKASSQPPPEETVMEETIRITRGRLRKTRSTVMVQS